MGNAIHLDSHELRADDRRLVTVLFVDVAGYTALAETTDAETVRDLLNELFEQIVPVVEQFGGFIDKFIGDCLMAVFGAPVSHEHHAHMALLAALAIPPILSDYNHRRSLDLALHIGLNSGLVVAGNVGAGPRQAYSVIGDVVNIASRLCECSAPGEILIGQETQRLVGRNFAVEAAGRIPVRGRKEEVSFYRVRGPNPGWSQASDSHLDSPFVGRHTELHLARQAMEALGDGIGAFLFVTGDAGVGKSRLVREIQTDAARSSIHWIEGRVPAFGLNPAHLVALSLIQSDLALAQDESAPSRRDKITHRARRLFPDEAEEISGWMEELVGIRSEIPADSPLFSADAPTDLTTRVCDYFVHAARIEPLVVCLDDVNWLDASSLALLEQMLLLASTSPILFLLVGRREPASIWDNLRWAASSSLPTRLSEISLAPLSTIEARELLSNLLALREVPLAIEQMVNEKAEGNPFFVEQILRTLVDLQLLVRDPDRGGFQLVGNLAELEIPNTVRGLIAARIDRLQAPYRQRLREASVIGRSFSYRLLAAVAEADEDQVARQLADLQVLDLIRATRNQPGSEYSFQHALVQEVTYESMLLKERKQLHRRVGEAAQRLVPENTDSLHALLAYHFSRSEDWERAQQCLIDAAETAIRIAADSDALNYYEQAMGALMRAFDEGWEATVGNPVEWFLDRLEPFWQLRRLDRLLEPSLFFQKKLSASFGPHDPRTLAAQGIVAGCYVQAGSYSQAIDLIHETLAGWEVATERSRSAQARLLLLLGIAYRHQDQYPESERALRQALDLANSDERISRSILTVILLYLSSVLYLSGRVRQDKELIEEALQRPDVQRSGYYWDMHQNLIETLVALGEWDEAVALGRRCLTETENPYVRAHVLENLGLALHACRELGEAEQVLTQSAQAFERQRKTRELAEVLKELAETQLARGKIIEAQRAAERALALLDDLRWSSHWEHAAVLFTIAGVEAAKGNYDLAEEHLGQSRRLVFSKLGRLHPFRAELFFRTAELELRRGRRERSAKYLGRATRMLDKLAAGDHPRSRQMETRWQQLSEELTTV